MTPSIFRPYFIQFSYILVDLNYDTSPPDCSFQSLDRGPRQRSMWLEKAELGQRLLLWGVGEELVQDEGLLTSQHEQRLSDTGPSSTDLHRQDMYEYNNIHINKDDKVKKACLPRMT